VAFRAPLTNHHADGTLCPAEHRHTSSGKPLHPDCPGRAYSRAVCSCRQWQMQESGKGYVNESRRRHLATHRAPEPDPSPEGPKVLRDLLRLDPH
jgi:hypothetical protein